MESQGDTQRPSPPSPSRAPRAGGSAALRRPGLANRLRHMLGLRQVFSVGGVRYREVSAEPLRHALSRKGRGFKEFDVTFPASADGRSAAVAPAAPMRIRCTPRRTFADLSPSRLGPICDALEPFLRPGMRILMFNAGTGDAAAHLARRVAPSGAVVSLDRDEQSVMYAQRRYRLANLSHELGGVEGLAGETDGAFTGVIVVEDGDPPSDATDGDAGPAVPLAETWRVVAPGGWAALAAQRPLADIEPLLREACPDAESLSRLADAPPRDGWSIMLAVKSAEQRPASPSPDPPPPDE